MVNYFYGIKTKYIIKILNRTCFINIKETSFLLFTNSYSYYFIKREPPNIRRLIFCNYFSYNGINNISSDNLTLIIKADKHRLYRWFAVLLAVRG